MNLTELLAVNAPVARRVRGALILVITVSSLVACQDRGPSSPLPQSPSPNVTTGGGGGAAQNSYADVVSRVVPGVVTIHSARRVRAPRQHPFLDDPFFHEFFGDRYRGLPQRPPDLLQRGLGSGVIVSADGYILTNHHVIDGAEEIKVDLSDNRNFDTTLIGSDPPSDLAVLKIDAQKLSALALANSDRVRVGDVVLAVGNPLGLEQTVTMGIVSAKGRSTGLSDGSFQDFLQTDAPINQGNSGGALVNTNGEVIGINSQILSPTGGNIGIGFAVPANMARSVMDQLIKSGRVRRGILGIIAQPMTSDIATSLGLREVRGAIVSAVAPGSPAERAGVQPGDVIVSFNGEPVADGNALRNAVAGTQPGTEVTLTVRRDGREEQLRATLAELNTGERS